MMIVIIIIQGNHHHHHHHHRHHHRHDYDQGLQRRKHYLDVINGKEGLTTLIETWGQTALYTCTRFIVAANIAAFALDVCSSPQAIPFADSFNDLSYKL